MTQATQPAMFVRDNEANMVVAPQAGKMKGVWCMVHTLNLVVWGALQDIEDTCISHATDWVRKVLGHFYYSDSCATVSVPQETRKIEIATTPPDLACGKLIELQFLSA